MHQAVNSVTGSSGGTGVVDLQRFSRSHFAFSLDLYSALASQSPANNEGEAGNLLFSPYSVSTALSMIFLGAGAGSTTSLQLRSALHLNNFSFSDVHDSYKTVINKLSDPYYTEILVTMNGIFQQEGLYISEKYKRALEEFYNVQIQPMDFMRHPQLAVDNINSWARNFTKQEIPHSLHKTTAPASIKPELGINLANGLAFRSHWLYRFDPASTFDKGLFYTTSKKRCLYSSKINYFAGFISTIDKSTVLLIFVCILDLSDHIFFLKSFIPSRKLQKFEPQLCSFNLLALCRFEIPMMVGRFKIPVGYSSDLECRIAELPFSSRRVSFFIILPDDVDRGITKLEANMSSDNIKALFSTLKVIFAKNNFDKFE
jgi:serine protease inhibitor